MTGKMSRRQFVRAGAAAGLAAASPASAAARAPDILVRRTARPIVIADTTGYIRRDANGMNAVEKAFSLMTSGTDLLDALIAGVNIPELDPEEMHVGYGALPNADGVLQLDACCMHGPERRAGGVAALEGVRTPSLVARAVMDSTDHHLLAGDGAQQFARQMGFEIEDDLNTPASRARWLEWKRRLDPERWLDPERREREGLAAAQSMVEEGLISADGLWGTINCDGVNADGDVCGVTTTSGLSFKIPGRVGDSPILGAGLYVDNDVGAAGSTGRGEANLYNLTSYLIVENMRRGMSPLDAAMDGLRRIRANTVERRLLNDRGEPNFDIRFYAVNKAGEHAGVAMYGSDEARYAVCTENGSEDPALEGLLDGSPAG